MGQSLTSLKTEAVAMVNYPKALQVEVERAGQLWQQFCAQPQNKKEHYVAAANPTGAVSGYEFKDGTGPHADHKENFDITPDYKSRARTEEVVDPFVTAAAGLANSIADFATSVAHSIENECHVSQLGKIVQASRTTTFVRFLHYFGHVDNPSSLAEPHTDQSGFTFHLYETAPGCERLDPATRTWINLPVKTGQTVLFPAMQLQLLSSGELKALCHRVVVTDTTRRQGRFVIVAFIRFANQPEYDKAAHGRLQEMAPGFNYDISIEEFSRLFQSNNPA